MGDIIDSMKYKFRWWLFGKTVAVSAASLVSTVVLLQFFPSYVTSLLIIGGLGYWTTRQKDESFWIGTIALAFYLVILFPLVLKTFLIINNDVTMFLSILSFFIILPFTSVVFLYRKQLYEIAWGVILVPLSALVFVATIVIELLIHPPSEE